MADCGELDVYEATKLFKQLGVKLSLTMAYNPEANAKVECKHSPIVKSIVRACNVLVGNWLRLLPYALWANQTTHSLVMGYMSAELMFVQKPIMVVESEPGRVFGCADSTTREVTRERGASNGEGKGGSDEE